MSTRLRKQKVIEKDVSLDVSPLAREFISHWHRQLPSRCGEPRMSFLFTQSKVRDDFNENILYHETTSVLSTERDWQKFTIVVTGISLAPSQEIAKEAEKYLSLPPQSYRRQECYCEPTKQSVTWHGPGNRRMVVYSNIPYLALAVLAGKYPVLYCTICDLEEKQACVFCNACATMPSTSSTTWRLCAQCDWKFHCTKSVISWDHVMEEWVATCHHHLSANLEMGYARSCWENRHVEEK